jgi:hypothetical protein
VKIRELPEQHPKKGSFLQWEDEKTEAETQDLVTVQLQGRLNS